MHETGYKSERDSSHTLSPLKQRPFLAVWSAWWLSICHTLLLCIIYSVISGQKEHLGRNLPWGGEGPSPCDMFIYGACALPLILDGCNLPTIFLINCFIFQKFLWPIYLFGLTWLDYSVFFPFSCHVVLWIGNRTASTESKYQRKDPMILKGSLCN